MWHRPCGTTPVRTPLGITLHGPSEVDTQCLRFETSLVGLALLDQAWRSRLPRPPMGVKPFENSLVRLAVADTTKRDYP